jgi:hypothetical protein
MDFMRLPFYAVHDALKTATIPVAAIYYATKESPKPPPAKPKPKPKPDTKKQQGAKGE